jgi:hypothetical protein
MKLTAPVPTILCVEVEASTQKVTLSGWEKVPPAKVPLAQIPRSP